MPRPTNSALSNHNPASRLRMFSHPTDALSVRELLILILAGGIATSFVALLPMPIRVPGHAILKATLPLMCGVALVPRHWAGTMAGLAALVAAAIFLMLGIGHLQAAAVTSLLTIGPAMDWALRGANSGRWLLYLRFALAGMAANLCAFAVRWGLAMFQADSLHPLNMQQFVLGAFLSFTVCGIAAGLLSGVICFRNSAVNENKA